MAGLGQLSAAAGLSKSVDYVGQNQREFAQMENVQRDIEKNQQENMLAQELEAKQYEEIAKSSAEMLGPDRLKIQSKSLELQKNIRSKIEEYGSRKAFFENGGIALISKYKSDILNSPETLGYNDNKKNMESLMKIMADGKGHLISDLDKQSLDDYNSEKGDGKIKYSGMKSEVVIPEKYYNYGQDVPTEVVLKSNYLQIYNNWLLDNPSLGSLTGDSLKEQLLEYTMRNHYGQGINKEKYQQDLSEASLRKQQKAVTDAGTKTAKEQLASKDISFIAEWNGAMSAAKEKYPLTLDNVINNKNYTKEVASKNPSLSGLAGSINAYDDADSNYTYADSNNSIGGSNSWGDVISKKVSRGLGFDNKYKVASATIIPVGNSKGIIEWVSPGSVGGSAMNVTLNQSEFYSPNGEKLKQDFIDDQDNAVMSYGGVISGFIDGNGKLVTQMLDSNKKPLEDDSDHRKTFSGNLTQDMFVVLKTKDNKKVFKRINVDSPIGESIMNEAIGASNNISAEVGERTDKANKEQSKLVQTQWNAKVIKNNVAAASQPGQIFATPEFRADASSTKVADGTNRYTLVKAYYMALSAMTDRNGQKGDFTPETMMSDNYHSRSNPNNFQKTVSYSPELKDALINKSKINDIDFINLVAKVHAGDVEEDIQHNQVLAQNWTKFYELLKK